MPRHLLSSLYGLIQPLTHNDLPPYTKMWLAELGKSLSRAEWQTAFHFTHKSSISCYSQEKNFKSLSRWYRDPFTLHKIFLSTPASCWRCGTSSGTYIHVWWECDRIQPFWSRVFKVYNVIYEESLQLTPEIALLSMLPGSIASQKRCLLCFFLVGGLATYPAFQ